MPAPFGIHVKDLKFQLEEVEQEEELEGRSVTFVNCRRAGIATAERLIRLALEGRERSGFSAEVLGEEDVRRVVYRRPAEETKGESGPPPRPSRTETSLIVLKASLFLMRELILSVGTRQAMTRETIASTSESEEEDEITRKCVNSLDSLLLLLSDKSRLTAVEIVDAESKVVRALVTLVQLNVSYKRQKKILSDWFALLGLTSLNTRHLEICGVVDVQKLLTHSQQELRSLADRGRFSPEAKRRLLKSSALLAKQYQSVQGGRQDTLKSKDLSWSFGSPSISS
ncbi:unnamed protein product [Caenorhabditis auriculariae]|uniref:Uncharacterized protein n=1 Tax=Caenorhabditis auriculariae TaxID=2777116 RepID=A0A8S1HXD3_9PELO|nr:unnamed protein product [Caenorhabditis auriculariae]